MPETCNSRTLSWFVKSCIPDPRCQVADPPPENHRHHLPAAAASSISSLPDDLLLEILSRVPPSSLPSLPPVSRRFSILLSSSSLRPRPPTLLALDLRRPSAATWHPLHSPSAWHPSPLPTSSPDLRHARAAAVGRSIYLIARRSTLRFDTWTRSLSPCAPTLTPRRKFAAAAINGRIYVAGGAASTSAVEEYDPSSDTWRVVSEAPRRRYGCVGAAANGVLYVAGGIGVGGRGAHSEACAGTVDAYHVRAGAWMRARSAVPGGGCVVGACGAGPHLYVVATHGAEVSFWRTQRGGGWARLEPPPARGRAGAVRFSCAGVGNAKVVVVVNVGGDMAGRKVAVPDLVIDGAVLVYDIAGGEWSRGPDLPMGFGRVACACLES